MNESGLWTKVRGAINKYPGGVAHKLTDAFTAGTPDCLYCIRGITGLLELKYEPWWPKRAETTIEVSLTEAQRVYLMDWIEHRGRGHVLLGVEKDWFLLEVGEVPLPSDPKKSPRIHPTYLEAIRERGNGGTFADLSTKLPALLARSRGDSVS